MLHRDGTFLKTAVLATALACASASADAPDAERLRKFELALRALGVPAEPAPDFSGFPVAGSVNLEEVRSIANLLDPEGGLRRYLSLRPERIDLFANFLSPGRPDGELEYGIAAGAIENRDSDDLLARLDRVARNVRAGAANPLAGLRVVVDPGHMGGAFWNQMDGKYVAVGGKTVAEGALTLSTAKLLATELEALGATVTLTRTDLVPATPYTWENFDPKPRFADYLYRSLDDWMGKYLALGDAELVRQIPRAPEVRKMQTAVGRELLFLQEDLEARARINLRAKSDVYIVLHFDSQRTDELQSKRNDVSVYVPGSVRKNETGSRRERAYHLKHLLEVRRWRQSARMAKILVDSVAAKLGLPVLKNAESIPNATRVADGVFARNLYGTRRATEGLCAFFESLHYDHVREFPRLATLDAEGSYRGKSFRYPSRLAAISTGIREGLIRYFREFD